MSKLFSRFGKSPHTQATLSPQSAHESPVRTGSIDSPRTPPTPISPSPLRTIQQPRVVLTSEASETVTTPTSPGSLHRQSSIGTSIEDIPRKNSLSAAQRQAFADQVARSNGVAVPDDMQTPRATVPSSPPQTADQHSTPKANGLRPSPSSEFKSPSTPAQDSPSVRKQPSATSLTAPPPAARSRRGSVASSDAGSTRGRLATQIPSPLPLVESPTSDRPMYASPRSSMDAARSPTRSTKAKQKSRTGWRSRGASGSAGGIAGALAQSGMSLAHATNPGLIAPPAPPLPTKQPTRAATAIPRSPSDTSLGYGGGGTLSKTTTRTRSRGGHDESSDSDAYDSEDALSFGPDEIPITGFAVASSKRNADFHELFPNVPDGDYLIEDYGCALQREILIQGRLYISENHICFHANIFGWITNFIIPFQDVTGLEKRMTAYVIPNAIQICTRSTKYTFASFLSRDTTFDVIHNIWRLAHPRSPGPESPVDLLATGGANGDAAGGVAAGASSKHRPTQCACSKEGKHYETGVIDTVLPGTPEKIYNLMFASGFVKDFMTVDQKLIDVQISDWRPGQSGSNLLARNMSYIKPLSGSIGPKQTKCELTDETIYVDFDDYVSTLTTTRTPDVPSGGVFSVKTRTCIMWAGAAASRLIVTTTVEWTGRSFIKSIIDKSAIDGQKQYHGDLEKAMRNYIAAHRTEFVPDDADADDANAALDAVGDTTISADTTANQTKAERARATELRGLQWLLDTFTGASNVAKDSFWGAMDLIGDLVADLPGTTALGVVVAVLVISNVWTMVSLREARAREKLDMKRAAIVGSGGRGAVGGIGGVDAGEAMRVLLEEVVKGRMQQEREKLPGPGADPKAELAALRKSAEILQQQVERLKKSLEELD